MTGLDRQVLRLAIPNLLASVSVPLVVIVDTAMIGRLPEVAFLGAVATASVLFDVLYWGVGFLRMAASAILFFVPAALLLVYGLGGGLQGAWLAYDALMVGRFLTLWRRFCSEDWLKTFIA